MIEANMIYISHLGVARSVIVTMSAFMFPPEILAEIGKYLKEKNRRSLFATRKDYWRSRYNIKLLESSKTQLLRGHFHYSGQTLTLSQLIDNKIRIEAPNLTELIISGNFGSRFTFPKSEQLKILRIRICYFSRNFDPKQLVQALEKLPERVQMLFDIDWNQCLPSHQDRHKKQWQHFFSLMRSHREFKWEEPHKIGWVLRSHIYEVVTLADFDIYKRRLEPCIKVLPGERYLGFRGKFGNGSGELTSGSLIDYVPDEFGIPELFRDLYHTENLEQQSTLQIRPHLTLSLHTVIPEIPFIGFQILEHPITWLQYMDYEQFSDDISKLPPEALTEDQTKVRKVIRNYFRFYNSW